MRTPDSPDDRRARNELLTGVARKVAVVLAVYVVVGALAAALGVPWLAVVVFGVIVVLVVVTTA